jgi:hypothetical protein
MSMMLLIESAGSDQVTVHLESAASTALTAGETRFDARGGGSRRRIAGPEKAEQQQHEPCKPGSRAVF